MTSIDRGAYVPLRAGLPDPAGAGGRVFDGLADAYDAARPGYPAQAMALVADVCGLDPSRRVLEVGCGTGQAGH